MDLRSSSQCHTRPSRPRWSQRKSWQNVRWLQIKYISSRLCMELKSPRRTSGDKPTSLCGSVLLPPERLNAGGFIWVFFLSNLRCRCHITDCTIETLRQQRYQARLTVRCIKHETGGLLLKRLLTFHSFCCAGGFLSHFHSLLSSLFVMCSKVSVLLYFPPESQHVETLHNS